LERIICFNHTYFFFLLFAFIYISTRQYLYEHGWYKFSTWFDYLVWYPLGRPVGTTIYPGMQVTSVLVKLYILPSWSINDICCYIPAWFGVSATLAVAWLTYECTRSRGAKNTTTNQNDWTQDFNTILNNIPGMQQVHQYLLKPIVGWVIRTLELVTGRNAFGIVPRPPSPLVAPCCAIAAAVIMSIVPAHLLRSVGGGYDNESIAMTAMVLTFAFWTLSLRDHVSIHVTIITAVGTGLAYFYMVAAWGGYVFVLNVIGVHAVVLVLLGRYTTKLHRAYSIFYIVGTILAIQVPVVGFAPLKSIEQLGPGLAFICFQLIEYCEIQKRKHQLSSIQTWKLRVQIFSGALTAGAAIVAMLTPTGYFGPISSRVRGLFVKHTKTGNPLVDSVAEHQAASTQAYFSYLMELVYLAPIAWVVTILVFFNDASSFLFVYGMAAYYFSHRMVRLILLTAPIASVLGGIFFGRVGVWMIMGMVDLFQALVDIVQTRPKTNDTVDEWSDNTDHGKKGNSTNKNTKSASGKKKKESEISKSMMPSSVVLLVRIAILLLRLAASVGAIYKAIPYYKQFKATSHTLAQQISHPTIIQKAQTKDGQIILLDDYREAYFWLRDNTPEDARIMAWWDCTYPLVASKYIGILDGCNF
jgi:dolichyl-diphosphooligosaccharide---protein glycosyltransferase